MVPKPKAPEVLKEKPKEPSAAPSAVPKEQPVENPKIVEVETNLKNLRKKNAKEVSKKELDSMREKIDVVEKEVPTEFERARELKAELEKLAEEVRREQEKMPVRAEAVKTTPQVAQPSEQKETWWKPQSWTTEHKEKATAIAIGGTVAIGGVLLFAAMRKAYKVTKEKVEEKVKKGWGWTKWIVGGLLVGGAAYLGIRGFQWMNDATKITTEIARLKEQAKTQMGEVKEATNKQIKALEAALAEQVTKAREMATAKKVTPETSTQSVTKPTDKPTNSTKLTEAKEVTTGELREYALARSLVEFHPFDWALEKPSKQNQVQDILANNRENKDKPPPKMDKILDWANGDMDMASCPLVSPKGDEKNREKAMQLVGDFCASHQLHTLEYIANREKISIEEAERKISEMDLIQYIQLSMKSSSAVFEVIDVMGRSNTVQELTQNMRSLRFKDLLAADINIDQALRDFAEKEREKIGITVEELKQLTITDVLELGSELTGKTVTGELLRLQNKKETSPAEKVLIGLFSKLEDDDTHRYLLTCFHGIFPSNEGTDDAARVQSYLMHRMTPGQALRFALYRNMIDNGNPAGLVLMQTEVIKFIADYDDTSLLGDLKYRVMIRLGEKLASISGKKLEEEWEKNNITLPPALLDNAANVLNSMGKGIVNMGLHAPKETLAAIWAGMQEHWIAGSVAVGATLELGAWQSAWNVNPFDVKESLQHWSGAVDQTSHPLKKSGNVMNKITKFLPTHKDIEKAAEAYEEIYKAIKAAPEAERATLMKLLKNCLKSSGTPSRWTALADGLDKLGHSTAASHARLFAGNARWRRVISAVSVPFAKGVIATPQWLYIRTRGYGIDAAKYGIEKAGDAFDALRSSPFLRNALAKTGTTIEELITALKAAKMPPQLVNLFAKSKGGMRMLCDAFKRAGPAGLSYLNKVCNLVPFTKLAKFGGPASAGLDVCLIWIERNAIDAEISKVDSPALKEFYEEKKRLTLASGIPTAALISLGFLPGMIITGAYKGAKETAAWMDSATTEWLKDAKDMRRDAPGTSLHKLKNIDPGVQSWNEQNAARQEGIYGGSALEQMINYPRDKGVELITGKDTLAAEAQFEVVEKTNAGQRGKLTRAYLANMTEDLPGDVKEDFARFQQEQMRYIAQVSGNTDAAQTPETYRLAHADAELVILSRKLKASDSDNTIPLMHEDDDGKIVIDGEFDVAEYETLPQKGDANNNGVSRQRVMYSWMRYKDQIALIQADICDAMNPESRDKSESKKAISHQLLLDVRHDLSAFDRKIIEADLAGWEWTGGEKTSRNLLRFAARDAFIKELTKISESLSTNPDAGVTEMVAATKKLRSFLGQDVAVFEKMSKDAAVAKGLEEYTNAKNEPAHLLDWRKVNEALGA